MKKVRKNVFKLFGLLLVAMFLSQTLTFGTGTAMAEMAQLVGVTSTYATALAAEKEISTAAELVDWIKRGSPTDNVKLSVTTGFVFDLTGYTYTPKSWFYGTFDGACVTIKGVSAPFFLNVEGAEIKNVYFMTGNITYTKTASVGGLVCYASGSTKITNCLNMAPVSVTSNAYRSLRVGGIVGQASGTTIIDQCSQHASVTATNTMKNQHAYCYAGGIAGVISGNVKITNGYVAPVSGKLTLAAYAESSPFESKYDAQGKNKYYNGLTHVVQKVNEDFERLKNQIAGKQNEESAINRSINSLKSQINSLERNISSYQNKINSYNSTINSLQRKIDNAAWYDVRKAGWAAEILYYRGLQAVELGKIAALRVSQGALWASIGTLEASKVVIRGAISALQATLRITSNIISYSLRDTNWLHYDIAKNVRGRDAYVYGITFVMDSTSAKIQNCYTFNVNLTTNGEREAEYTLVAKFWTQSEWLGLAKFSSNEIKKKISFVTKQNYGPIANKGVTSSYYFDTVTAYDNSANKYSMISGSATKKEEATEHSVHASLKKQQMIIVKNSNAISVYVANGESFLDKALKNYAGVGTLVVTKDFDTTDPTMYGTKKSHTSTTDRKVLDSSIWGSNKSEINNNMPYLKGRYWQDV